MLKAMLLRGALLALSVPLIVGSASLARSLEESETCPVSEKITRLLGSWKAATAKEIPAAEKASHEKSVAAVRDDCPVGSRMGVTLATLKDALTLVVSSDDACQKACPLENEEIASKLSAEALREGHRLKKARRGLLVNLSQLVKHTSNEVGQPGECESTCPNSGKATKTGKLATAPEKASRETASSCPIRVASRLGTLKASWTSALGEVRSLTAERRQKLLDGFARLAHEREAIGLVPPSLEALTEGLRGLRQLDERMMAWASENPALLAAVPESTHRGFQLQAALLDEAGQVLAGVQAALEAMQASSPATIGEN